ncbi:MAG: hypothetical protein H7175_27085, partial [Burkholderiales bacterium]|nr:hypothetical protein [Anaerolineae bacterium]
MNIPQTGREPLPLSETEEQKALRKRHREDSVDPFASDPNAEIRTLGKLALRRNDINDLFALGDLCARRSLNNERLLVFYVGKALLAYRKAAQAATHDIDRSLARRIINDYVSWVIHTASEGPTRRNLAVALWAVAEGEEDQP